VYVWTFIHGTYTDHYGPWVFMLFFQDIGYMYTNCFLPLRLIMKCYVLNALLCLTTFIVDRFLYLSYVLTSPAHLYMPQLFTQYLPSITCVRLNMSIVYVLQNNCFTYFLCVLFSAPHVLLLCIFLSPYFSCILCFCMNFVFVFL